jgi:hypothetical protein
MFKLTTDATSDGDKQKCVDNASIETKETTVRGTGSERGGIDCKRRADRRLTGSRIFSPGLRAGLVVIVGATPPLLPSSIWGAQLLHEKRSVRVHRLVGRPRTWMMTVILERSRGVNAASRAIL